MKFQSAIFGLGLILLQGCAMESVKNTENSIQVEESFSVEDSSEESLVRFNQLPQLGKSQTGAVVDLDGDGRDENILLISNIKSMDLYDEITAALTINNVQVASYTGSKASIDGFVIVDIDEQDPYKEIALFFLSPSGGGDYILFRYDGINTKMIGEFPGNVAFPGDGTAFTDTWMGFWQKRDFHVFDSVTQQFVVRPAKIHLIEGLHAKSIAEISFHQSRNDNSPYIITVQTGSIITFVAADISPISCPQIEEHAGDYSCDWYKLSYDGITGWVRLFDIDQKFEYLPHAG